VAKKSKAAKAAKTTRKARVKRSAKKKVVPKKKLAKKKALAKKSAAKPLAQTLKSNFAASFDSVVGAVATAAFRGVVRLIDALQHSILDTTNGPYLLMLDPQGVGGYSEADVNAAYLRYRVDPGGGNLLSCVGFVQQSGNVNVLHVAN
jgi:hypothetical protein